MHKESCFEKMLREMQGKDRQELLERIEKIFAVRWPTEHFGNKRFAQYPDDLLRFFIADLQCMGINSDLEYAKAVAQFKNRYKGRQKGRAYKSFLQH